MENYSKSDEEFRVITELLKKQLANIERKVDILSEELRERDKRLDKLERHPIVRFLGL